jgi:glycosyltransferase involved in cell wall biosynthesis
LKVLHIITGLQQGGAEAVLYSLVAGSPGKIRHIVVSLDGDGHYGPLLRASGAHVHCLNMRGRPIALNELWNLYALIRDSEVDIVQTWMYHGNLVGGVISRLAGIRSVVWTIHNLNLDSGFVSFPTRVVGHFSAWLSPLLQRATVYVGENAARVHGKLGYRSSQPTVIPNGVDIIRFRPLLADGIRVRAEWGISPSHFLLGFVARWDKYKDHRNLFAALAELGGSCDDVRCALVGPGINEDNQSLMSAISEFGLRDRMLLVGPRDDIPAVMNALDMHVLSSIGEGFGNVTAEAMACGTPCITTDVGSGAEIVGNTGWVVPPGSSSELARAIRAGMADIKRYGKSMIGVACRDRIVNLYSVDLMVERYFLLWKSLVDDIDPYHV